MGPLGVPEMIVIGIIALLLFGKNLPKVARDLGKGVVEFKKGLRGIDEEVDRSVYAKNESSNTSRPAPPEEKIETSAPKFEPPTSEPTAAEPANSEPGQSDKT